MADDGPVLDLTALAAAVGEPYANRVVAAVNDHVVRMSVMTGAYHWHRHPESDETFLVTEGILRLETEHGTHELGPGQLLTVPAGVAHCTSAVTERTVNLTVEAAAMTSERVDPPAR